MDIVQWWPRLEPSTREWLVEHNGEVVPAEIVEELRSVGASLHVAGSAVNGDSGHILPDHTVDWIEAVANEELPATDE